MGTGYVFRCKDCGKEYGMSFGLGFGYSDECQKLRQAALSGELGDEWRRIMSENEYYIIKAENYLYYCRNCGRWEFGPKLSIYAPKDLEDLLDQQRGDKTVRAWGYDPWGLMSKEDYKLIRRYRHVCPECKKAMKQYGEHDWESFHKLHLKCPDCNGELAFDESTGIMWD